MSEVISFNTEEDVKQSFEEQKPIDVFPLVGENHPILKTKSIDFDFENPPFNPNEFAGWLEGEEADRECYTKRTGLWGKFNKPEKIVLPVSPGGSWIMKLGGKSERTKELRSMTPLGFSYAFFEANK